MSKDLDNKYFIILNKDEIIFNYLNNENKILFTKKHNRLNISNNLIIDLENFFKNYLIKIEKNLKNFIRKIYIIIDHKNTLSVDLSIRYDFHTEKINKQKINNLLNTLKNQFTRNYTDHKVIHMVINKSIVEGKKKNLSLEGENFKNLILEIRFECLENKIVYDIEKFFSDYQISVKRLFLANHLKFHINNQTKNVVHVANKIICGEYENEVMWYKKKTIKDGFFEKFFKFFS